MQNDLKDKLYERRWTILHLRITKDQHAELKRDANKFGLVIAGLARIRLFGKQDNLPPAFRPPVEMRILGDTLGRLGHTTSELNKIGFHLDQISKRLGKGERDLFMLDSSLRHFERMCANLTNIYALIESAVAGKKQNGADHP